MLFYVHELWRGISLFFFFCFSDRVLAQSGSTSQLAGLLNDSNETEEAPMKSETSHNSFQPAGLELTK